MLTLFTVKTHIVNTADIDSHSVLAHEVIMLIYEKSSRYQQLEKASCFCANRQIINRILLHVMNVANVQTFELGFEM